MTDSYQLACRKRRIWEYVWVASILVLMPIAYVFACIYWVLWASWYYTVGKRSRKAHG